MNQDVPWKIIIKTANTPAAGIDDVIYVKIHGEKGSIRPIELGDKGKSSKSPFSRNCTSQFLAKREDVGMIKSIEVWHNAKTDWHCQSIEVQRGDDSWMFRPEKRIASQADADIPKATRLEGEYTSVSNGATGFHNATKGGDITVLERMLTNNEYEVNVQDKLGRTPAHYAVLYGQKDALDLLIEFKADLGIKDKAGKQTLHHACVNHVNNVEIVKTVLKYAPEIPDDEEDESESRVIHFIRDTDIFGKNAMHYAATYGFVPLVQLLDSKCRIAIRDKDYTQQNALHCAAIQGEIKAALCLIDLGAQIDDKDRDAKTFMHHAATAGHDVFIDAILNYDFDETTHDELLQLLETPDVSGRTPIICAASDGGLHVVKCLYNLKADIFHLDSDKSNALHHAAKRQDEEMLSFLTQKIDINSTNDYDYTALHVATEHSNVRAVRWLLKHKADIRARTISGETALELAQHMDNDTMTRLLSNAMQMAPPEEKAPEAENEGEEIAASVGVMGRTAIEGTLEDFDDDDSKAFFDPTSERYDEEQHVNGLMDEIQSLKDQVSALKQTVKKKNRIIEILKNKMGGEIAKMDQAEFEEQVATGRLCQTGECTVM